MVAQLAHRVRQILIARDFKPTEHVGPSDAPSPSSLRSDSRWLGSDFSPRFAAGREPTTREPRCAEPRATIVVGKIDAAGRPVRQIELCTRHARVVVARRACALPRNPRSARLALTADLQSLAGIESEFNAVNMRRAAVLAEIGDELALASRNHVEWGKSDCQLRMGGLRVIPCFLALSFNCNCVAESLSFHFKPETRGLIRPLPPLENA